MPRFNVQHPDGRWACFSTVVDDYITDFMARDEYQKWRENEYGRQAGTIESANQMSYEEANETRDNRKRWNAENIRKGIM